MKLLAVFLMLVASPALANCNDLHRAKGKQPAPSSCAWQKIKDGFAVTAGFRWDKECPDCPTILVPVPPRRGNCDPFFLGAELRLPITDELTLAGNFDRDWTDSPDWNARVHLSYRVLK